MDINRKLISEVYMCDEQTILDTTTRMIYFVEELRSGDMPANLTISFRDYRFLVAVVKCLLEELRDRLAQETNGQDSFLQYEK